MDIVQITSAGGHLGFIEMKEAMPLIHVLLTKGVQLVQSQIDPIYKPVCTGN